MKVKLFRLISFTILLAMIITPVSAMPGPKVSSASPFDTSIQQMQSNDSSQKIEPELLSQLELKGKANGFVLFKDQADLDPAYEINDWVARGQFVVDTLQQTAERSQRNILNLLESEQIAYTSFWVNNSIYVTADLDVFNQLASYPEVERIRAEQVFEIPQPEPEEVLATITAVEWNIASIMADQVWVDFGIFGDGVVVGSIDTGVQYDHPALVGKYRGNLGGGSYDHNYNWHDPSNICGNPSLIPCDNNGHGTHVTGTMVGDDGGANQIGVAPGAKWISAKGCESNSCSEFALLSSGQWILAPTDLYGDNPDVEKRPHIINNSWGGGNDNDPWYQPTVQAWVAAGIFPAFAIGNAGPTCGSAGNPGNMPEAYAAGGYNSSDGIYVSGSRGPSAWGGIIKPNISAPGQGVRSSVPTNTYATFSGTSMASPHVAGTVALMWSAAPVLAGNIEATREILDQTARDRDPVACGGTPENNNDWGEGQLDAYAAVFEALAQSNAGTLEGTVTESGSGDPIEGVTILADGPYTLSTTTNELGEYSLLVPEGTYDVSAIKYGYVGQTVTGVEVLEDQITTLDFVLEPADTYTVSGTVTDVNTGWPLYASIDIAGYPEGLVWTDPVTGEYSINLVGGFEFTFSVDAWVDGYLTESRPVGPLDDDSIEDFALAVDGLSCTAPGYSLDYLYYQDFDADNGGFTIEGPSPAPWQWGTPVSWPSECVAGTNCWGTNLNGSYNNNANQSIISPVIDLSEVAPGEELFVRWSQAWHIESASWDKGYAEVSIDGGDWLVMWEHIGGTVQVPWTDMSYDLSAAAGGEVQFRFRFTSDASVVYNGYYIDALSIVAGEDCQPQPGGLIVGNVYESNAMQPMVGALVESDSGEYTYTVATPLDPNVDDGFYTLFGIEGANELTASMTGYSPDSAVVMVGDGETVHQDFILTAGYLEADPDSLFVDVLFGSTETVELELINSGDADVQFETVKIYGGYSPGSTSKVIYDPAPSIPAEIFTGVVPQGYLPQGAAETSSPAGDWQTLASAPFVSMDNVYLSYEGKGYQIGGYGTNGQVGIYDADTNTWTTGTSAPSPSIQYPVDGCFGFDSGGDPVGVLFNDTTSGVTTLHRYNIATDTWDTPPVPAGFPANGLWAHDITSVWRYTGENVCYISGGATTPGGGNTSALYAYYPDTNTVDNLGNFTYLAQGFAFHASWYAPWIGSQGGICVGGGVNAASVVSADTQCYDIGAGVFNAPNADLGAMPDGVWGMADGFLYEDGDYQLWIAQGADSALELWPNSAYYSYNDAQWYIGPPPPRTGYRVEGVNIDASDGFSFYVVGGSSGGFTPTNGHERNFSPDAPPPPGEVNWLIVDPSEGTVPAMDSITLDVTFDAGAPEIVQPGLYSATLRFINDTPYGPLNVPVTMNVIPTETTGMLDGTVIGLGYCDDDPAPLSGAEVLIESDQGDSWTVTTDSNGYYYIWLDEAGNPYTLTVSASEHHEAFAEGVLIVGQDTVTVDFELYWMMPCVDVEPGEIEVWVAYGAEVYQHPLGLDIINAGGADIEFTLWELPDLPLAGGEGGISSLTGSFVAFDPSVGGDEYYLPGTTQTFCFEAKSHSPDWEYALSMWQKFPSDWEVTDVYVQGTPSCTSGGTWGTFAWLFHTAPYEVRINHPRYHASGGDTCTAYYCFEVTSTPAGVEAPVSWYWNGDNWGSPPYNPCSDDGYTPSGQPACDEAINPVAAVPIGHMDVPWFWQDPESGVVPAWDTLNVDLLFTALDEDSEPLPMGDYTATLILTHSDPFVDPVYIPITMHILEVIYGVDLAPEAAALSGDPGQVVEYTLTLTNTGNLLDTFEVAAGESEWDVHLPETIFELEADASADVIVHVTVPADAMAGEFDVVTITATSLGDPEVSAASELTTTANTVYGLMLVPEAAALADEPGETVEYTLTLSNSGNTLDTFELTFEGNLWDVHLPVTSFDLAAGESADVIVHVSIPADAEDGDFDAVTVTATSTGDAEQSASSELTTTAAVDWKYLFAPIVFKQGEPIEMFSLTILHTNDFHARVDEYNRNGARCTEADADAGLCIAGTPRIATVVDDFRANTGNLLVLDAGDQFQGTLFFTLFQSEVLNETMNYIGYDAMSVGNHEFDSGPSELVAFIQGSDFPVISSNIEIDPLEEPELASLVQPYVILERGGHEIGVIGITTPDTENISSPGPHVTFSDPITSLQATADELTTMGVDKIIALTHQGYDLDLELATSVSGVDVIIGGHSHSFTYTPTDPIKFGPPEFPQYDPLAPVGEYPTVVQSLADEPVLVVTAYQWGSFLGNLQVTFDHQGLVLTYGGNPIFLGTDVEKDPVLDGMLDPYRDAVQELIETPVGETTVDLLINVGGVRICRVGECLMGNLVADAMLWMANEVEPEAGYQIAFQNGGGLRAPIMAGVVTMGDVLETLPFGNTIATFELQGSYVKAALENGAWRYPSENGGFAQVAGLRYTIDPAQEIGERIVSVDVWNGTDWDPLNPDAMYKVVTNDFMRRGGDGYTMFRDYAVDPYDFGPLLDEALADYFMEFSPVTPEIEGRIIILD